VPLVRVRRVGFVGTRAADMSATEAFFRDVLGLDSLRSDPDWSILQLPTGSFDFVEIFGAAFEDERLAPSGVQLFVAFVVDDLEGAHAEVQAAGSEAGEIVWAEKAFQTPAYEGFGWFFVRAPDGNVYCIQQAPD
jgi:catechol 2,3-dioxygenase-like lactoylglutathione lyase family enzyme